VRNSPPPPISAPTYQPSQQQAATTLTRVPYEKGRFLWWWPSARVRSALFARAARHAPACKRARWRPC